MEFLGYFSSIMIGAALGLIGGGGSILTVPVLVYLFHIDASLATSYSLFIVGSTSLLGVFNHYKSKQIHVPTALVLGATSILTVLVTRHFILPAIPAILISIDSFTISKSMATMLLFAALMVLASVSMIRSTNDETVSEGTANRADYVRLALYGIIVGLVTGLMGAGGGFLLIPALIFMVKLPVKKAIGTSLLIISMNSLFGFAGDFDRFGIDWKFLLLITALAATGIVIGTRLGRKMDGGKLKKGFGWFVLIMGLYIIIKELLK